MAKTTVRSIWSEAATLGDEEEREKLLKHASKSEQANKIRAMIELAATEPEIALTSDRLDADPWLFNVENGTLDLRSGALRPHRREDLITRLAPVEYSPRAKAQRWRRFMLEVMDDDAELVDFLQRAVGYAMTGDTREQCLFFCYGQGANGKSTFLETLRGLFGPYALTADFSSFMGRSGDGPRTDLARMRGARFVAASEADSERGFDGRVVKALTGSDTIVARKLYEAEVEYRPTHKLFLAANHRPIVKEQTDAFWRRMRLVPFRRRFERGREKDLEATLRAELPGILVWALEGCLRWQAEGLNEPRAVKRSTHDYKEENDLLGEFITARAALDTSAWTSTVDLYRVFGDWWVETRGPRSAVISLGWFTRMLGERADLSAKKSNGLRGWRGITLQQELVR
jgi:putative DNA primase/helicase